MPTAPQKPRKTYPLNVVPSPPINPLLKNLLIEIVTPAGSYLIAAPLHPSTDPHAFVWTRDDDGSYRTRRFDAFFPATGISFRVTTNATQIEITSI